MSDKEIIVCTTLRDFQGSENDLIQLKFLNSLKSQEKVKVKLIITLFGEKNVQEVVEGIFPDAVFYEGSHGDYRYSLTQVINNSIDYIKNNVKKDLPIFWTTCDVIYEKDFILKCIPYLEGKSIVTSHPHKIRNLDDDNNNCIISGLSSGFDMLIFSSYFIDDIKFREAHNRYVFKDWGVYEHFLISLSKLVPDSKMFNIYEESVISKIENDRQLTNEPSQFLISSHKKNTKIFNEFLSDHSLTKRFFNLTYCHLKFKITKNSTGHYIRFLRDLYNYYFISQLKFLISKVIPNVFKKLIKRKVL